MGRKGISDMDDEEVHGEVHIAALVYDDIMKTIGSVPPETGGILGGRGNVIEKFFFDGKHNTYDGAESVYVPDITKLNSVLQSWYEEDIAFAGVVHSHPSDMRKLSSADVMYAIRIMQENDLKQVYFPLVMPDDGKIIWYAVRLGER